MKLIGIIFYAAHWIACTFFAVGYIGINDDPMNWILQAGLEDAPVID